MKTFERTAFKSESVIVISCFKKPLGVHVHQDYVEYVKGSFKG